jgi:hypothetical protein
MNRTVKWFERVAFGLVSRLTRFLVAQVSNLLYRRLPVGQPESCPTICRLEICDTADWKSALQYCRPTLALVRLPAACIPVLLAILVLIPASTHARINVVTLPGRDSVQLTIYNSVDLTLVRETRSLTFRKGLNRLEFSWANTLIDPTSVEFRALTHADGVDVLDVSFPPRVANTLEWRIQSDFAGEAQVEIRYFTSGISWAADYVAEAAKDEKAMSLAGNVRINNNSGEDYENAQVRLVVGVIRLVESIVQLARQRSEDQLGKKVATTRFLNANGALGQDAYANLEFAEADFDSFGTGRAGGRGGMGGGGAGGGRRKEIKKESLSEYFLYTVEGRDTIPTGWSKRLPSFKAAAVPVTSYYKFEKERWGENVMRHYRFTNSAPSKLGKEPLPDGAVKAFRLVTDDGLYSFVGRAQVKYIPIDEIVEMELGRDQEVLVKPRLMNWEKTDLRFDQDGNVKGWTVKESWEFEVQNSKDIDIVLDLRRNFSGDWSLATTAEYEKVDADKVKFVAPLQPRQKRTFGYELTTRYGVNATR